jgi:RNA polymerase sigma-32 factor
MSRQIEPELARYISKIHAYPRLSREEEMALVDRWSAERDPSARQLLLESHLRYVVAIALRYRRYGVPVSELIAEGNFGVLHALDKFESSRGTRFVTYAAYWIRAYALNHIIRSWSLVGVGSGALRSKMFFKLRRERVRIANLVGEGDHADEMLAERLNLPKAKVTSMVRRLESRDVSLDTRAHADSSVTLLDGLVAGDANQEQLMSDNELGGRMRDVVRVAIDVLDHRERYIVEKRLMADSDEELSLAEIGRQLGVSRERARQLEARAKRKLRSRIAELSPQASNYLTAA